MNLCLASGQRSHVPFLIDGCYGRIVNAPGKGLVGGVIRKDGRCDLYCLANLGEKYGGGVQNDFIHGNLNDCNRHRGGEFSNACGDCSIAVAITRHDAVIDARYFGIAGFPGNVIRGVVRGKDSGYCLFTAEFNLGGTRKLDGVSVNFADYDSALHAGLQALRGDDGFSFVDTLDKTILIDSSDIRPVGRPFDDLRSIIGLDVLRQKEVCLLFEDIDGLIAEGELFDGTEDKDLAEGAFFAGDGQNGRLAGRDALHFAVFRHRGDLRLVADPSERPVHILRKDGRVELDRLIYGKLDIVDIEANV